MGQHEKIEMDAETLYKLALILKARDKIDKIEMESEDFVKMLKEVAKNTFHDIEGWGKAGVKELDAWGDALKGFL